MRYSTFLRNIASVSATLYLLQAFCVFAQPTCSVQLVAGYATLGAGYAFEYNFYNFDSTSILQSLRSSVAIVFPITKAWYLPIDTRIVAFHGSHHVELAATANIQLVHYDPREEDDVTDRFWASSQLVVPAVSIAYRLEAEDGGFLLRLGWALAYYTVDRYFTNGFVFGFGYSW